MKAPNYKILLAIWMIIVLVLSTMPSSAVSKASFLGIPNLDKIAHFVMYFIFALLASLAFKLTNWQIFFLVFCYGLLMECVQHYFLTNRYFEIFDIIANIIGTIVGIMLIRNYLKK